MAVELRHSDREDPFSDLSRLSLFPLTLGASSPAAAAAATVAAPGTQEPESIQYLFQSMALEGSTKLLEQAQAISKSSFSIQTLYSKAEGKAVIANGVDAKEGPQGRRPALGHRRAQFSLKAMPSHSSTNASIDQLFEPHEYFLAYGQLQKADEEMKKLEGGAVTDLTQHNQSTTARKHRPGILGRTASYKHHLSANADTSEAFRVSQEVFPDRRIPSPAKSSIDMESSTILHPEATEQGVSHAMRINSELSDAIDGEGSLAEKEQSINDLLEKLFSSFKDLDGGNGAALLRERLQIKSTDVGKMNLTELDSSRRNDLRTLKNLVTKTSLDGSQLPQHVSPTPTRSPLAVIATLKRHISLKDPLEDPCAMPTSDDALYLGDSSLSMGRNKQSLSPSAYIDHRVTSGLVADGASAPVIINGKSSKFRDKMHLPVHDADNTIDNEGHDMQLDALVFAQPDPAGKNQASGYMNQNDTDRLASPSSRNVDRNSSSSGIHVGGGSSGHDATLQCKVNVMLEGEPAKDSEVSEESLASPSSRNADWNSSSSGINVSAGSFRRDAASQREVNVTVQGEPVSDVEASKDNSSPPRAILPVDGHPENLCILPEENNEGFQEASGVSADGGQKRKAPPSGQNKRKPASKRQSISRRQSLADAGLMWKSGVRRSTRIRSRPLQYWCGERFLYGRIHDSLATVIGLKYACSGEDGKDPVLKVKSFVPDKYADLLSQAAL